MPDERREIRIKRPASHTCSRRFIFYNTRGRRAQGGGDGFGTKAGPNSGSRCDVGHRPSTESV